MDFWEKTSLLMGSSRHGIACLGGIITLAILIEDILEIPSLSSVWYLAGLQMGYDAEVVVRAVRLVAAESQHRAGRARVQVGSRM